MITKNKIVGFEDILTSCYPDVKEGMSELRSYTCLSFREHNIFCVIFEILHTY